MEQQAFASAHDLWAYVEDGGGERWLGECTAPFWGRPGARRPPLDAAHPTTRACEDGIGAKSVFQVGGAGAVGTGSLRGMPMLLRLHAAGFRIWPYDDGGLPVAIEIYPRRLTGPVRKSSRDARAKYIEVHGGGVDDAYLDAARGSEDAFDALFSAIAMWRHVDELRPLPPVRDANARLEGLIWCPGVAGTL
jgi:hypothetical protein